MKKGKLIKVELQPGRFVKMYEADAIEQGLVKRKAAGGNKMRRPAGDKKAPPSPPSRGENKEAEPATPPADDLTTIAGIGKASERALNVWNIRTFAELRAATDLSFLSGTGQAAIERWIAENPDPTGAASDG